MLKSWTFAWLLIVLSVTASGCAPHAQKHRAAHTARIATAVASIEEPPGPPPPVVPPPPQSRYAYSYGTEPQAGGGTAPPVRIVTGRASMGGSIRVAQPAPVRVAASEALEPCDAAGVKLTASACANFMREQQRVKNGFGSFRPAPVMTVDKVELVKFAIAPTAAASVAALGGGTDGATSGTRTVDVRIGARMRVQLTGAKSDFEIEPVLNPTLLGASEEAVWIWNVTPLSPGPTKKLVLSVDILSEERDATGAELPHALVPPQEFAITVNAAPRTASGLLSQVGETSGLLTKTIIALTALITALTGLRLAIRKFWGSAAKVA
jgi:hypothetical protein